MSTLYYYLIYKIKDVKIRIETLENRLEKTFKKSDYDKIETQIIMYKMFLDELYEISRLLEEV